MFFESGGPVALGEVDAVVDAVASGVAKSEFDVSGREAEVARLLVERNGGELAAGDAEAKFVTEAEAPERLGVVVVLDRLEELEGFVEVASL